MSSGTNEPSLPPSIAIRWLRPTMSTPYLQLLSAPITASNVDTWIALTEEESAQCEEAWDSLSAEQRIAAEADAEGGSRAESQGSKSVVDNSDEEDETVGITIFEDRLFEINVRNMEVSVNIYQSRGSSLISSY